MNPKRSSKDSDAKAKKRREQKRMSMQRAREKIKNDEALLEAAKAKERERWHKRKTEGSVKSVKELSNREQRRVRKKWRESSKKYRQQKKRDAEVLLNTPPDSPLMQQNDMLVNPSTSRVESGRRVARKNREKLRHNLKKAEIRCKKFENKAEKYRKKYQRLLMKVKGEPLLEDATPRKRMAPILQDKSIDKHTKRRLFMNEVICHQIKKKFQLEKSRRLKKRWSLILNGAIVKKYRCLNFAENLMSRRFISDKIKQHTENLKKSELKKELVTLFLEQDRCSRMCPGKKDTKTKNKEKKQKRFLNDTMKNLLTQFKKQHPQYNSMSLSTFCRYRPFWIMATNAANRETCLCKIHENFSFMVKKLKKCNLIEENSTSQIINSLCCKEKKDICLERTCNFCLKKNIKTLETEDDTEHVSYEKWVTKKIPIVVKKVERLSLKTFKTTVTCTKKDLVKAFKEYLPKIMIHTANINHQYRILDTIKKELKCDEIFIHMDFSENYECKYAREIQSVHFGGSKPQVTLHTVVVYYCDQLSGEHRHKSFVTLSDCNLHSAVAIAAHLEPVIKDVKEFIPQIRTVHFLSDGPTTQYRNKYMFQIFGSTLSTWLESERMAWHYSESSHGKGAPDGIGGAIKRAADAIIAKGEDVPDFETLVSKLQGSGSSINIIPIEAKRISELNKEFENIKQAETFKGTLRLHQVTWTKGKKVMQARRLSCTDCNFEKKCVHYNIGEIPLLQPASPNCILFSYVYKNTSVGVFLCLLLFSLCLKMPTLYANRFTLNYCILLDHLK